MSTCKGRSQKALTKALERLRVTFARSAALRKHERSCSLFDAFLWAQESWWYT